MTRLSDRAAGAWWSLVRFGFRLLYNELAWSYDLVSWVVSLGQWRQWQRAGLAHLTGGRVVEIAHGTGHMLLALEAAGYDAVGLDLSPAMGRIAARRLRRAGGDVPLVRGRAEALPFAAGSFDSALSTFPTDFALMPETLAAVQRALRPGGRYVIVGGGFLTGRGLLVRLLEWLYWVTGQRGGLGADGGRGLDIEASPLWRPVEERFRAAGFTARPVQAALARSVAVIIIADKGG